jgi:hypothetical protein
MGPTARGSHADGRSERTSLAPEAPSRGRPMGQPCPPPECPAGAHSGARGARPGVAPGLPRDARRELWVQQKKKRSVAGKASHGFYPMRDLPVHCAGAVLCRRLGHTAREPRRRTRHPAAGHSRASRGPPRAARGGCVNAGRTGGAWKAGIPGAAPLRSPGFQIAGHAASSGHLGHAYFLTLLPRPALPTPRRTAGIGGTASSSRQTSPIPFTSSLDPARPVTDPSPTLRVMA